MTTGFLSLGAVQPELTDDDEPSVGYLSLGAVQPEIDDDPGPSGPSLVLLARPVSVLGGGTA